VSETTSEPSVYSPFDPVAWQHIGQNLLSTVPGYDPNEPWYQKALDYASIPARMMVGGIKQIGEGTDAALHSPNLLQDPYAQHQLTRAVIGTAGLTTGMPVRPAGSLGVFGGVKAATADLAKLEEAKGLQPWLKSQYPPAATQATWNLTGWNQGPGGDWRFEIPDEEANLYGKWGYTSYDPYKSPPTSYQVQIPHDAAPKLGEVLDHKALYDAYPQLKDITVHSTSLGDMLANVNGWYNHESGAIGLTPGPPEAVRSTLLHEIQHAVQHIEGFPRGGSTQEFLPENFDAEYQDTQNRMQPYTEVLRNAGLDPATVHSALEAYDTGIAHGGHQDTMNDARQVLGDDDLHMFKEHFGKFKQLYGLKTGAFDKYTQLAGEIESRMVEERLRYSPSELERMTPEATPGHPSGAPIIKRYDFPPHFSLEPVDHDPFAQ
jgi:hypothetical protein